MQYNNDNIFAKIIRKELPADIIYEDEKVLAFKDINPVAPVHILVVPKGQYIDFTDFISNATKDEISYFFQKVSDISKSLNLDNYRIISNKGSDSGQTVFHFHVHIISGKQIRNLI